MSDAYSQARKLDARLGMAAADGRVRSQYWVDHIMSTASPVIARVSSAADFLRAGCDDVHACRHVDQGRQARAEAVPASFPSAPPRNRESLQATSGRS